MVMGNLGLNYYSLYIVSIVGVHRIQNFEIRPEPDLLDFVLKSGRNRIWASD